MRHTRGHTANRRSHHKLTKPTVATDGTTGSTHLRHRVDLTTGMYRGTKVTDRSTAPVQKMSAKKVVSKKAAAKKVTKAATKKKAA
jgi:large subunit ribosomal protein L32